MVFLKKIQRFCISICVRNGSRQRLIVDSHREDHRFSQNKDGSVAVILGLGLTFIVAVMGLSLDLSRAYLIKNQLQLGADSGALAGAVLLSQGNSASPPIVAQVRKLVSLNTPSLIGDVTADKDVIFGYFNKTTNIFIPGNATVNAVQVFAHQDASANNAMPTYFERVFGVNTVDISSSAIAVSVDKSCFIMLDPSASPAFKVEGQAGLIADKCQITVNSNATTAAVADVSAVAKKFCITGGFLPGNFSPPPERCPPAADPLRSLPEPVAGPCMPMPTIIDNLSLAPGTYCSNLDLSSVKIVTFQPGTFYFQGTNLNITGSTSLSGTGVTMFFDKNSGFNISTSGNVNLQAPKSGTYSGISIFQSRAHAPGFDISLVGGGSYSIDGVVYAPNSTLSVASISSSATDAYISSVIVGKLFMYGDSQFHITKDPLTTPNLLQAAPSLVL